MVCNLFRLILILICVFPAYTMAANKSDDIENQLKKFEGRVKAKVVQESELKNAIRNLGDLRTKLAELLDKEAKQIEKTTHDLTSLGQPIKKEPADVAKKRKELETSKTEHEKRSSKLRLLILRLDDVSKNYADRLAEMLRTHMMARTSNIAILIQKGFAKPGHWVEGVKKIVTQPVGLKESHTDKIIYIIAVAVFVLMLSIVFMRKLKVWVKNHEWGEFFSDQFACALSVTVTRWLPYLTTTTILAFGFRLVSDGEQAYTSFYLLFIYGLPIFFSFLALIEFLLVPREPASSFLVDERRLACSIASRFRLLLLMLFIALILFSSSIRGVLSNEMFYFARSIFAVLFFVMLVSLSRVLGKISSLDNLSWLRLLFVAAIFVALISELTGYRNLSATISRVSVGILIAFSLLMFLRRLFGDIYNGLEGGDKSWQTKLRNVMGISPGSALNWLPWMRFLTGLLLWSTFLYILLRVVGLPEATLQQVYVILTEGFAVGSLKIIPERIFWAIVTFFIFYLFSSWFKVRFEKYLGARMRMERGAREAMATMVGYIGMAAAIIVALGISGFTFTNLAIIAGALSVGIGFGLQNIVNNFVSGLILLFERPVKTGDWIMVGNTEGYVKKIRIRSTQIQTFDRADVIVPNSDMISNQVTNWMLYDLRGRIRVKVGVAYGSDTQKIKDILYDIAKQHPDVIHNNNNYKTSVLFLEFGDSSLNFELRCFIRNIDSRIQVLSDLNFAIDQAFRENGIEIPFPQRDVHIKGETKTLPSDKSDAED